MTTSKAAVEDLYLAFEASPTFELGASYVVSISKVSGDAQDPFRQRTAGVCRMIRPLVDDAAEVKALLKACLENGWPKRRAGVDEILAWAGQADRDLAHEIMPKMVPLTVVNRCPEYAVQVKTGGVGQDWVAPGERMSLTVREGVTVAIESPMNDRTLELKVERGQKQIVFDRDCWNGAVN